MMVTVSVLTALKDQRIALVINILGEPKNLHGTLLQYSKPFIKMEIAGVTRIFNENIVREIIPTKQEEEPLHRIDEGPAAFPSFT